MCSPRIPRSMKRAAFLIVGVIGFGVLLGLDNGPNMWVRMLIAGAAAAWLGLWSSEDPRASLSPVSRAILFVVGVIGFGLLWGLKDSGVTIWTRALIAGAAGAWLGLFRVIRPLRRSAKLVRPREAS